MRRSLRLAAVFGAGLALSSAGCSDSAKPAPAAVPANPVAIPKNGPSAGGAGAGGGAKAPAPVTQGANKTPVQ